VLGIFAGSTQDRFTMTFHFTMGQPVPVTGGFRYTDDFLSLGSLETFSKQL
jgi:hypothetical protein